MTDRPSCANAVVRPNSKADARQRELIPDQVVKARMDEADSD